MSRIAPSAVLIGLSVSLLAQDNVHFVPSDRVAVRAVRDVPSIEVAPGVHVRTVVGSIGSFSLGEFEPGGVAPLHHHTREQVDVGISGVFDVTLGNHVEPLAPGAGLIIPPNVRHSIANVRGGGVTTVVEFHTVRRPDMVPPRPAVTFPASAEPTPIPDERQLVVQLATSASQQTSTPSIIVGETSTLAWRRVEPGAPLTEIATVDGREEVFAYIVGGVAVLVDSESEQRVGAGTLIVIPPGTSLVKMRAIDTIDLVIAKVQPPVH